MGRAEGFTVSDGDLSSRRVETADIGVIGLAVMGENLVLNMASCGYTVAVYNRTTSKVDAFLAGRAAGKSILGAWSAQELVATLARPRRVMLMVQAGCAVDRVIETLVPLLEPGDVLVDGGNSNYQDTTRRTRALRESGILYVGAGVSGGEEGALLGPSIMPGGNADAWPVLEPIFKAIAAKVDDGTPCCEWIGPDGAGHYVKMVHNGIEYGDMQMIAEAYSLLRDVGGIEPAAMSGIFEEWNQGELSSYLVEITAGILARVDDETGRPLVDLILDAAGQKGTGKWTGIDSLMLGAPVTAITEAVFARALSALKDERVAASRVLPGPETAPSCSGDGAVESSAGGGAREGRIRRVCTGPGRARCGYGRRARAHGGAGGGRGGARPRRGVVCARCPPGALRLQDLLLRAGLPAPVHGFGRVRAGASISAPSRSCGAAGASSAPRSSTASTPPGRRRRILRTCCSRRTSVTRWPARRPHGGGSSPLP